MIMNFSCNNCRKAKRKCDRELPSCSLCLKRGKHCSYAASDGRKPATHGFIKALFNRIDTLEYSLKHMEATQNRSLSSLNIDTGLEGIVHPLNEETIIFLNENLEFNNNLSTTASSSSRTPSSFEINNNRELAHDSSIFNSMENEVCFPLANRYDLNVVSTREGSSCSTNISFHGPSSMRFIETEIQISAKPLLTPLPLEELTSLSINQFVDQYHKEVFTWFFQKMNHTFPLIDQHLFFSSLNDAIAGKDLGKYSSMSLINSIMSFYCLFENQMKDFEKFKKLATEQLDEEIESTEKQLHISSVQTLILLSIICMTSGDEIQGSQYIARAVALTNHLGLQIESQSLIKNGGLSHEEVQLRRNVYCCCFLTDKVNSAILGSPPYLNRSISNTNFASVDLNTNDSLNHNFSEFSSFIETVKYYEKEAGIIEQCFNIDLFESSDYGDEKNFEDLIINQKLSVSSALVTYHGWKKDMDSNARFRNNKSMPALFLEVSRLTLLILIYKTILQSSTEILTGSSNDNCGNISEICNDQIKNDRNLEDLEEFEDLNLNGELEIDLEYSNTDNDSASFMCLESSKRIIKLCFENDISDNLYLYRIIYGIYVSCVICLYNFNSKDLITKRSSMRYFKKGIGLLNQYQKITFTSSTYINNLHLYSKKWFSSPYVEKFFHDNGTNL